MDTLIKLKREREPLYIKYSDVRVKNNGHFGRALEKMLEVWNENSCY